MVVTELLLKRSTENSMSKSSRLTLSRGITANLQLQRKLKNTVPRIILLWPLLVLSWVLWPYFVFTPNFLKRHCHTLIVASSTETTQRAYQNLTGG